MTTEKTKEFQESRDGCAERERTAAALLAALIAERVHLSPQHQERNIVADAVALADALRAALRGAP